LLSRVRGSLRWDRRPPGCPLFPYTTLFRSAKNVSAEASGSRDIRDGLKRRAAAIVADRLGPLTTRFRSELKRLHGRTAGEPLGRSEEHTSELQSRENLVCRPLLEK